MTLRDLFSSVEVVEISENSNEFRHFEAIGGEHCITAALPQLQDMLDWLEGRCEINLGYYRFVDHPALVTIQKGLAQYFDVHGCLVYSSFRTSLMELLEYLLDKPSKRIHVLSDGKEIEAGLYDAIVSLGVPVEHLPVEAIPRLAPFPKTKADVLVVAVANPLAFCEQHADFLSQTKRQRVPIVVCHPTLPEKSWNPQNVNFWVSGLSSEDQKATTGVILGNADRQMGELKELRTQRGPILSSRDAERIAQAPSPDLFATNTRKSNAANEQVTEAIERIRSLERGRRCFLYPSGMNAISTLMTLLRQGPRKEVVVIGHLYTDTYSLLTYGKVRGETPENRFLDFDEMDQLGDAITEKTAAIITETITNPLNDVPALAEVIEMAKSKGIPCVVDNTFATPFNCNPLTLGADYVIHSTTKFLNGENDHGGGAIVVNSPERALELETHQNHWGNYSSPIETELLLRRMTDFENRMEKFNRNAKECAQFLEKHPAVKTVFFNGIPSHASFENAQKLLSGPGSVMSFVLQEDNMDGLSAFYDGDLGSIIKAPSLGSNQTLVCPYTMLAHYHEPDDVLESLHLSRYLIRLSVGSEPTSEATLQGLKQGLDRVLDL